MTSRRTLWLLPVFLCLLSALAISQTSLSGAVAGTARDAQQAAVVHAQITLQNLESGNSFSGFTGDSGAFRLEGLTPGSYALKAASPGFADFGPLPVTVEVGRITEIAIHFAVAGVHETVEVREHAPGINTAQPDFANNIDDGLIEKLPINGRRWSNFALLTPTATLDGIFGLISFRGISGLANNSTIDGADNNQAFFSEERGRTRISYVISQESVREFQVNTSNFSAEYGRAAGATVNAITRSGGNRMHGSAFYFIRDNQLGATNAFTAVPVRQPDREWTTEKTKPLDRRQQFGGSVGGPIIKDKLFYFASFDAQRRDYPAVAAARIPSALFAKPCVIPSHFASMSDANRLRVQQCGTDSSDDELYTLQTNVMPPSVILPSNGESLDTNSINAFNAGLDYLASLLGPVPRTADHQIALAKLDYHVTPQHTIGLLYNRQRWSAPGGVQSGPVLDRGVASFGFDGVKVDTLIARLTSTLTPSAVNELRYSWSRDFEYDTPHAPAPNEPAGPSGYAPEVALEFAGGFSFGTPDWMPRRALPNEARNQIADTISWVHKRHTFKFGFDANRVVDETNDMHAAYGAYHYYRRDNFIADLCQWRGQQLNDPAFNYACYTVAPTDSTPGFLPSYYRGYGSYVQGYGGNAWTFHTFDGAAFAQDDWRIAPRLTLNFGLRYEFQLLPAAQAPNPLLAGSQKFPNDLNNFGPRFGFALALTNDGKTSLRGGYGLYYGRMSNSMISSALSSTGTMGGQRSYSYKPCYLFAKDCLDGPLFPNVYPSSQDPFTPSSGGNVVVISPHMQNSQIHQMDLVLEREVAHNTVLSASFLVSLGRELPNYIDINLDPASRENVTYTFAPDPRTGETGPYDSTHTLTVPVYTGRLNPNFQSISEIRSNLNSFYHALVVQLNHTSTRGLGFHINYTLARAQDDGQGSYAFPSSARNHTLSPAPFIYSFDSTDHTVSRPDYGTSNFDVRQRIVASLFWSPRPMQGTHGLLRDVLDHWTLAPIIHISSGKPYTEHVSGEAPIGTCSGCDGFMGTGGVDRLPFLERNSFRGRAFYNTDMRISRRWTISESGRNLEFMAEVFNLFNHQNVTQQTTTLYRAETSTPGQPLGRLVYDSNFGTPTAAANTIYREREIQLGIRANF